MKRILPIFIAALFFALIMRVNAAVTTVPCEQLPALTGSTTSTAGSCATTTAVSNLAGLGTGIASALGINIGSAGAPTLQSTIVTVWTPTDGSGAGLSFSSVAARWYRISNMVVAYGSLTFPATADGTNVAITSLPVAYPAGIASRQCQVTYSNAAVGVAYALPTASSTTFTLATITGTAITNAQMSTATLYFQCVYSATA